MGFLVYQVGTLVTTGAVGAGFFPGLVAVLIMAGVITWLCLRADRSVAREYALSGVK